MFEKITDATEVRLWEGSIPVRHRYTAGVAGEQFFRALRDRGEFLASRCETDDIVYCPPRLFCERCFSELQADATVGPGGTLVSFSVGYAGIEGESLGGAMPVGLVELDGADTVILHHLLFEDDTPVGIGDRVEAVLRPDEDRSGSILDIRGFRPVRG